MIYKSVKSVFHILIIVKNVSVSVEIKLSYSIGKIRILRIIW